MVKIGELLDGIYEAMEGSEPALDYSERHNVRSHAVLTVTDDEMASLLVDWLEPQRNRPTMDLVIVGRPE